MTSRENDLYKTSAVLWGVLYFYYSGFPKETPELKFRLRFFFSFSHSFILVPRGRAPFGQHQEFLWPSQTTEVRDSRTSRHSAHVQSQF